MSFLVNDYHPVVMKFAQDASKTFDSLKELLDDLKNCQKGLSQFGDSFKFLTTRLSTLVSSSASVKPSLNSLFDFNDLQSKLKPTFDVLARFCGDTSNSIGAMMVQKCNQESRQLQKTREKVHALQSKTYYSGFRMDQHFRICRPKQEGKDGRTTRQGNSIITRTFLSSK